MLVLLIIFMVTAPMMQRGSDVNLPQARRAQPISDQRLFVTRAALVPQGPPGDARAGPGAVRVAGRARAPGACGGGSDKQVFLQCDAALSVQDLMDVMDRLKEGGVEKVAIVAKFPERLTPDTEAHGSGHRRPDRS